MLCMAGLYALVFITPAYIGSAYSALSLLLSALMIYVWRAAPLTPRAILYLGISLYIILIPAAALTSNDSQRYLWDGAVFIAGFDPYITAPNATEVAYLRGIWPTPEEHANYATLYPPGALVLFGASAVFGPIYGPWVWKLLACGAGILTLVLGYKLLQKRKALQPFALLALNPLLLLETGIGAHVDIFCALGITAALLCVQIKKPLWAGIIIGLAATVKFIPALIAGPLLFFLWPKQALKLFIGAALTWYLIYLGAFHLGYQPLGLLPTFFDKWRGGAPLYPWLEALSRGAGLNKIGFAAMLGGLALIGFSISAGLAAAGRLITAISLTLCVPLLLSPVLFPWYLCSLIPLLALRPAAALLLPLTIAPLFYIVLNDWLAAGIWALPIWFAPLLAAAIMIGLIYDLYKTRQRRISPAA